MQILRRKFKGFSGKNFPAGKDFFRISVLKNPFIMRRKNNFLVIFLLNQT